MKNMKKLTITAIFAAMCLTGCSLNIKDLFGGNKTPEQQEVYVPKFLSGEGAPTSDIGNNTDRYTDTVNGAIYEKQNGAWILVTPGDTTYVVTFNLNGGHLAAGQTEISPQVVREGRWVARPTADPIKEHCEFIGWFAAGSTTPWNFLGTGVYGNVDLIAQYRVMEELAIKININPNNGSEIYQEDTYVGDYFTPSIPSRPGYEFAGWYIGETRYTGTVTSDMNGATLVAKWEVSKFNVDYVIEESGEVTVVGILNRESTTVSIPSTIGGRQVTRIKSGAFSLKVNLMLVNLPDTIKTIDDGAFTSSYKLMEVNVDSKNPYFASVSGVLYNKAMTKLICYPVKQGKSYTCPSTLKEIGAYAFYDTKDMGITSIQLNEGLEVIGDRAFALNETLNSITFPSTLKKIGKAAFMGLANSDDEGSYISPQGIITNNTLNEGLEEIGEMAFANQYFKQTFEFPSTVKTVGDYAFANCTAIEKVVFPKSLENYGKNVFAGATGVMKLGIQAGNTHFDVVDDVLYTKDMKTLVMCPSGRVDPIVIPEGVTALADQAFYMVDRLTDYTFPSTLKTIGYECFAHTYDLLSFRIPDSVTSIGENCFDRSGIRNIVIGAGLTEIPDEAFIETGLTSVVIPGNIKKIGSEAFSLCKRLSEVTLEEGVEEIGSSAFYNTQISELNMPNSLKTIGDAAFRLAKITSLDIKDGLESIGSSVFVDANGKVTVTTITVSSANQHFKTQNNFLLSKDGKRLILSASTGDTVAVPNGVEVIDEFAFAYNKVITNISLPSTLVEIKMGAFYNTKFLSITIPNSVKKIGEGAFASTYLKTIDFGTGVEEIGDSAFTMSDLISVALPNSVKKVGSDAFAKVMTMTTLSLGDNIEEIGDFAFSDTKVTSAITIPASCVSIGVGAFSSTVSTYGAKYQEFVVDAANPNYSTDGTLLMDKAQTKVIAVAGNATSVTIPSTVTEIADYGMACNKLAITSLQLPSGLTKIGEYGLAFLTKLSTLNIPASVNEIGEYAFAYYTSSQSINFGVSRDEALSKYDKNYFAGCLANAKYLGE